MYTLLVIIMVIVAILMIGIVLIQESKGGGLASNFSSGNQVLGVRKTTDIVEKTTWALAAIMVIISIACAYVAPKASTDHSVLEGVTPQTEKTNPITTPKFGADADPKGNAATQAAPAANATDAKAETPAPAAKAQ